jgi:acyl-CoA synthetase (AMP-forming)/AMP-acid ligase II
MSATDEIEFGELPKTSTAKVKKYELRERERSRRSDRERMSP